jgi:hypothetical protein
MIGLVGSVLVVAFLALGACVVAINWVILCLNIRDRKIPDRKCASQIGLAAQIFVMFAALISSIFGVHWIPGAVYWFVALFDIALWQIMSLPFVLAWLGISTLFRRNA